MSDTSSLHLHLLAMRRGAAVGLGALLLAGCGGDKGSPPPPPPPTVAEIKIQAAADVNATAPGQGAPVVVRIYQLGATNTFERAEFFPLLHADSATLGSDLIRKEEYLLAPEATKEESAKVGEKVQAIGIFAVYRDFQTKTWRATVALSPNKTTPVIVKLGADGVTILLAH